MILWSVLLLIFGVYLHFREKKVRSKCQSLPGPLGYPFLGNGIELASGGPEDYFSTMNKYWLKYGNRFRLFLGDKLVVSITDPKDVEVVLMNQQFIEKSHEYTFVKPWLGTGLLTSGGEKWKKHRKAITPTFHFKILESFIDVFDKQSDIFVDKLRIHANKEEFDIHIDITRCALDIICETAMGVSVNAQQDTESEYVVAVKDACAIINERIRNPLKRFDFLFQFFPDSKLLEKSLKILHGYTNSMIRKRRKVLEKSNENLLSYTKDTDIYGAKKKMVFLDLLLLTKIDEQPLSDTDIREEVDTFLFEGHDTVSAALSFAVYLLGKNLDVQDKLYKEQMEIFSNNEIRPLTHSDLQNMKYLELVIKETLRLYPSVPLIARKINEETMINDMKIPEDSSILILCYCMNRNPEVFYDPEKFIPERFLSEEANKRNPFSSVFFSAGPRNCIGQKFAMLEMKSTLAKLVRNYIVKSNDEPLVLSADIILQSVNGINVKLTTR